MKRFLILLIVFSGCTVLSPLQKSKFISVFHLIDVANFEEAKVIVEEMIESETSSQWARTWYARGLLCQTAYQEGIKKNNKKHSELYPDQLYEAFDSYEKARSLDKRGRLDRTLAPKYVVLANDLQKLGERHFKGGMHEDALRAFEKAYMISQHQILAIQTDNNLIYNIALSAYEGKNWAKSIEYLNLLNAQNHSTNVLYLLFSTHIQAGDTISAKRVLAKGINQHEHNEELILLLADLLFKTHEQEAALKVLEKASRNNPTTAIYPYTTGLIYQKTEQYPQAIQAFQAAHELDPDHMMTYIHLATCNYNIGVEIEVNSRRLYDNRQVHEEKVRSEAAFQTAIGWLDKAYDKKSEDKSVILELFKLYKALSVTEKVGSMESQINAIF